MLQDFLANISLVLLFDSHLLLKTLIISLHFFSSIRKESLILCTQDHYTIQDAGRAPSEGSENLTAEFN